MLKEYTPGEVVTETYYELAFDDGFNNGFAFPCDKDGNVGELNKDAERNLKYCLSHPDEYQRFNKIIARKNSYRENSIGICECGECFSLVNEYFGACECPKCGKWYNLFGQELLPPDQWEEDY